MVVIESVYKKSDWSVDGKGEKSTYEIWPKNVKVKIRNVPIYPHQEKSGRGS